jgi:hypothetical protein
MVLATIDEWFEADFERDNGKNNLDLDFEIIDMIHFIIQTGFLIIMEAENISFDDKQVIEIFKKKVLLGFDNINDFMSFKKKALYGYHFPYETPISKNMFFENIIYSFQYLLENIHWKTWKKYSKYTEQELNNILNYLSTLFVNLLQNMYIAKRDELSIEEFANYATELYVIKNIENFDRQDRGY